jgi:hypothetical protein
MKIDATTKHQGTFNLLVGPLVAYSLLGGLYAAMLHGKWIWFSWHPISMMISFFALAGNAALIKKIGGYDNTKKHGTMMFMSVILGLFGWYVIYSNKEMMGKKHVVSLHGKLGVITMLAYLAFGVVGTIFLNPDFGISKTNQTIRFAHKWGGRVFTALGWYVCVTGKF